MLNIMNVCVTNETLQNVVCIWCSVCDLCVNPLTRECVFVAVLSQDHVDLGNQVSQELEEPGTEPDRDSPVSNLAYAINTECVADNAALQVCPHVFMSVTMAVS